MESTLGKTSSHSSEEELAEPCPQISGPEPGNGNYSTKSSDEPEEDADPEFQNVHNWFMSLHDPSTEDHVRYEQAKRLEKERKTMVAREKLSIETTLEPSETHPEEQLIDTLNNTGPLVKEANQINEPQPETTSSLDEEMPNLPRATGERKAQIPKNESSRIRELGLATILAKRKAKGPSTKKNNKKNSGKAVFTNAELDELFVGDYIQRAQASASMAPLPDSSLKNKRKVVAEWIASVPLDEKAAARSDGDRIIEASKKYDGLARYSEYGWKIKGLKTLLKPYQLEAGGWMIDREKSESQPRGGLLCHEMGLGKTLTALLTVNERQSFDPKSPTLVVVPRCLVTHWIDQIREHCGKFKVIAYCSGSRIETPYPTQYLREHDIVITAYEEVRASYPTTDAPKELTTREELENWWDTNLNDQRGPFHEIYWHRIILDEGHLIRNKDSKISIATQALSGKHKWVLTGTPLHNRAKDLFPYLMFIGVPGALTFEEFTHNFCSGTQGEERLKTVVRSFTHRRTHESRLFSAPLVSLPMISETHVQVDLCSAEKLINEELQNYFINKLNAAEKKFKQTHCILTLILRCRMFTSHLLTVQHFIQKILNDEIMSSLMTLANESGEKDGPTATIFKYLQCVREKKQLHPASPPSHAESESQRPRPPEDKSLLAQFQALLSVLHKQESWVERVQRYSCASCGCAPLKSFLTSCFHRYCEECFEVLPGEEDNIENAGRICKICEVKIRSAIFCVDVIDSDTSSSDGHIDPPSSKKRKANDAEQSGQGSGNAKRKRRPRKDDSMSYSEWMAAQNSSQQTTRPREARIEKELDVGSEPTVDIIAEIGSSMPGAKLTAVRKLIQEWVANDETVKIVLFVEFMDSIRVLEDMCRKSKWKCVVMHGKVPPKSRSSRVTEFRDDKESKIMITSMRTGGIGIDLSMASKCIIYDPGWNAAVEQQAYCRLHRIGQTREVEYVKLMAKDTIDEWIFNLQKKKTEEINKYISRQNFMTKNTIKELLAMFGDVTERPDGGFWVKTNNR